MFTNEMLYEWFNMSKMLLGRTCCKTFEHVTTDNKFNSGESEFYAIVIHASKN